MDDDELALIRARRMAEIRSQQQGAVNDPSSRGMSALRGPQSSGENPEAKEQAEAMRQSMLMQLLENEARQRLSRIALVKPQNARSVEDMIIKMAQSGRIQQKITEPLLIKLLENISGTKREPQIVFTRRGNRGGNKSGDFSDSDDDDLILKSNYNNNVANNLGDDDDDDDDDDDK